MTLDKKNYIKQKTSIIGMKIDGRTNKTAGSKRDMPWLYA